MNISQTLLDLQNKYGIFPNPRRKDYVRPIRKWAQAASAVFMLGQKRRIGNRYLYWERQATKWAMRAGLDPRSCVGRKLKEAMVYPVRMKNPLFVAR